MAENSKPLGPKEAAVTVGGLGALLSLAVTKFFPGQELVYAAVPAVAAAITYVMNWFISRYGLESPEDASKRAKCHRDIKEIDKQLKSTGHSDEYHSKLIQERERTVDILVSIGRQSIASGSVKAPDTIE